MTELLEPLVEKALHREAPARSEALAVLAGDDELLDVVAAGCVRRHFFGHRV